MEQTAEIAGLFLREQNLMRCECELLWADAIELSNARIVILAYTATHQVDGHRLFTQTRLACYADGMPLSGAVVAADWDDHAEPPDS